MKLKKPTVIDRNVIETSLDLDRIIFDGDRDLRASLMKDRDFAEAVRETTRESGNLAVRRALLLTSVRLTPRLAPELFTCVRHCTEVLGIQNEIEVYCSQDAQMNAFIVPPQQGRLCIGFSNVALERFDEPELRFILGHELGHALFRHSEMPLGGLTPQENAKVSPLNAMRLHAWLRYAELSCDRVGLVCCGDFETSVRTFFKLTSGLSAPRWMQNVTATAMHYAAQEAEAAGPGAEEDWFSTHPYSPLRVKALELFSRSKTYHRLVGSNGGSLTEAQLEQQVAGIVELMNPSILSEKLSCKEELKEFLAIGGYFVARADGRIRRNELRSLSALLGAHAEDRIAAVKAMDEAQLTARAEELAGVLRTKLPPVRWLKIVEDLCSVALADGSVSPEETFTLAALANLLNVMPSFIDETLQRANRPLD
ncbi:MAG: M48 family metallopeptidase [Polyangiaceae bacterium]|jgi:uncharacterized tellurite resistance protein B-like protein|nr:M48 family metallopeptidase [Polyangiaceae bacterium]